LLDVAEIFLADLLPLCRVEVELVETFVEQLVRAKHCLLELEELATGPEVLEVGGGSGGRGGCADEGGGIEKVHLSTALFHADQYIYY